MHGCFMTLALFQNASDSIKKFSKKIFIFMLSFKIILLLHTCTDLIFNLLVVFSIKILTHMSFKLKGRVPSINSSRIKKMFGIFTFLCRFRIIWASFFKKTFGFCDYNKFQCFAWEQLLCSCIMCSSLVVSIIP